MVRPDVTSGSELKELEKTIPLSGILVMLTRPGWGESKVASRLSLSRVHELGPNRRTHTSSGASWRDQHGSRVLRPHIILHRREHLNPLALGHDHLRSCSTPCHRSWLSFSKFCSIWRREATRRKPSGRVEGGGPVAAGVISVIVSTGAG